MKREEALKIAGYDLGILKLINVIYDDFESRTCENCEYYYNNIKCIHVSLNMIIPPKDFGCNKFERKEV